MQHNSTQPDRPIAAVAGEPSDADNIVTMRGITKSFGSVAAVDGIDFGLRHREIHALLGENGAGKTTLMNILYGLVRADAGSIDLDGHQVQVHSPQDAIDLGIGMVHQHFKLVPNLTVAENIVLGQAEGRRVLSPDMDSVGKRVEALGERYGLKVPPHAYIWQLSVGEQQRVEILRALYRNARVLILDEPTATLAPKEVDQLLDRLRALTHEGASIVIITHHLDEVMTSADRISVLRRGKRITTLNREDTNQADLARTMVGRDTSVVDVSTSSRQQAVPEKAAEATGQTILEVENLAVMSDFESAAGRGGDDSAGGLRGVSFLVRAGEIVSIAGVEGNGQAELEKGLFGLQAPDSGTVRLLGNDVTGEQPRRMLKAGVGYIPSDRYRHGLVRQLSVAENLVSDRIDRPPFGSPMWLRPRAIIAHAAELIAKFSIAVRTPSDPAAALSGGNAQRVVLARALSSDLQLLLAAQPTRGLDVGAIEFVWEQLRQHREHGLAILLISTDLDEIMALSDRCYVMYRGGLTETDLDRERIGLAMGGAMVQPRYEGVAE